MTTATPSFVGAAPEETFGELVALATVAAAVPLAFITVLDDARSYLHAGGAVLPDPVLSTLSKRLLAAGGAVAVDDVSDEALAHRLPIGRGAEVRAWAGCPIQGLSGEIVGGLFVVSDEPRHWSEWEIRTVATLARAASQEIALREALRLSEQRLVAMTRAHQIAVDLARTLQDSLLPPILPGVPGVQVAARYQAAGTVEVVGDFYDLFHVVGDWWCAVIGDVCGHGVEAAKVTALARYTLRADANQHERPSTVLADLHHALVAQNGIDGRHLTAVYATFRVTGAGIKGRLCLAGHPAPVIRRADGTVRPVGVAGSLLGAFDEVHLTDVDFDLGPGDLLLLYTDGLTERRGPHDGEFGDDEFHHGVAGTAGLSAYDSVTHIVAAADAYSGGRVDDDTALLAIQVNPER
jgi:serine phosphatase RsbU (regulator of sigma subunit)